MKSRFIKINSISKFKKYIPEITFILIFILFFTLGCFARRFIGAENENIFSELLVNIKNTVLFKDKIQLFSDSFILNIIYLSVMFLSGFSLLGVFVAAVLFLIKGFGTGFVYSFIISAYGINGIWILILGMMPYVLMKLFSLIKLAKNSCYYSVCILALCKNTKREKDRLPSLKKYFITFIICLSVIILSSLYEGFVLPSVLRMFI